MQPYYGIKLISAELQEKDGQEGYKVVYEGGYESWSPKEVFEKAYRPNGSLSFSHALEAVKAGKFLIRSGWNGKNLYIKYNNGRSYGMFVGSITGKPYLELIHRDDNLHVTTVPWVPSIGDCLAEDWSVMDEVPFMTDIK